MKWPGSPREKYQECGKWTRVRWLLRLSQPREGKGGRGGHTVADTGAAVSAKVKSNYPPPHEPDQKTCVSAWSRAKSFSCSSRSISVPHTYIGLEFIDCAFQISRQSCRLAGTLETRQVKNFKDLQKFEARKDIAQYFTNWAGMSLKSAGMDPAEKWCRQPSRTESRKRSSTWIQE